MNTLISFALLISCAVSSTLSQVTINFKADTNSCSGKHAYVYVIDPGSLIPADTLADFPFDVVSAQKSISMPLLWYGQFYPLSANDGSADLYRSTAPHFVFDFQVDYKDYIMVSDPTDFTGKIEVAAADNKTLQAVAGNNGGYVCGTVTAPTRVGVNGDQNQICDPTTVGSYIVTISCP